MKAAGAAGLPFWKVSQRGLVSELRWDASSLPLLALPHHTLRIGFGVLVVGGQAHTVHLRGEDVLCCGCFKGLRPFLACVTLMRQGIACLELSQDWEQRGGRAERG